MIPDRATFRRPVPSHRLLYAGDILALPARLRDGLTGLDCFVVYSPVGSVRTLVKSDIKYSLLLFDDTAAGVALESFTRSLAHHAHMPVMLVKESEGFGKLLDTVRRRLGTTRVP
jgi:hypothetical protein